MEHATFEAQALRRNSPSDLRRSMLLRVGENEGLEAANLCGLHPTKLELLEYLFVLQWGPCTRTSSAMERRQRAETCDSFLLRMFKR